MVRWFLLPLPLESFRVSYFFPENVLQFHETVRTNIDLKVEAKFSFLSTVVVIIIMIIISLYFSASAYAVHFDGSRESI